MKKSLSIIFILLGGICWGMMSLFVNVLNGAGFSGTQIVGIRVLVAVVVYSLAIAIISPSKFKIQLKDLWLFICIGGICVALTNFLYIFTIIESEASVAVVLMYTSPIFVLIFSAIFFKEKITVKKIIVIILTFLGCIFVAGIIGGKHKISALAFITGIGSGLCYGLYSIFGKLAIKKYDTYTTTLYAFIFAFVFFIPLANYKLTFSMMIGSPNMIAYGVGIGLVCSVLAYFFYTLGLSGVSASNAAILSEIEPVVATMIGIFVFKESHNALKIIGIVLVLLSIVILNINFKKKEDKKLY